MPSAAKSYGLATPADAVEVACWGEVCAYEAAKAAGHPVPDKLYPPATTVDADAEPAKATTSGKRRR